MAAPRVHGFGDEPAVPEAVDGAGGGRIGALPQLFPNHEIRDDDPAPAAVPAPVPGGDLGAQKQSVQLKGRPIAGRIQAAAGGGLVVGELQQLLEMGDRRLQAACFFLSAGSCILIYGMFLNRSTNWEHLFLGFVFLIIGVALSLLTLAGGAPGRAAARAEGFLMRGFF